MGLKALIPEPECPDGPWTKTFCEKVVYFDWNDGISYEQGDSLANVTGVLWHLYLNTNHFRELTERQRVEAFAAAKEWRTEVAREEDSTRGEEYDHTVQKNCVCHRGYDTQEEFLKEVPDFFESYEADDE